MGRLDGKTVFVTGGARGMGASHARLFVAEGARVIVADLDRSAGAAIATELGTAARFVPLDVSSEESWAEAVAAVLSSTDPLDALVNNAGISVVGGLAETTRAQWDAALAVNLTGAFLGVRACLPALKLSPAASVINVSSTAGLRGYPDSVAYTASKFGLRGLTKAMAVDLAPFGIRVNSVHPGTVRTDMARTVTDDRSHILMQRMGEPAEISQLALFLVSDESSFCTGAEFVADGGETAGRPRGGSTASN